MRFILGLLFGLAAGFAIAAALSQQGLSIEKALRDPASEPN